MSGLTEKQFNELTEEQFNEIRQKIDTIYDKPRPFKDAVNGATEALRSNRKILSCPFCQSKQLEVHYYLDGDCSPGCEEARKLTPIFLHVDFWCSKCKHVLINSLEVKEKEFSIVPTLYYGHLALDCKVA